MYEFSNAPPPDPRGNALQLIRTPVGRALKQIVTCEDLVGCPTHFYHGRTRPCAGNNCEACADGLPWRWHGYLSCYNPTSRLHSLFEMTAKAAEPLIDYRKAHGTLRGCLMTAKRVNLSPNARVLISTTTADLEKYPIPKSPRLLEALSILWNIPRAEMAIQGTEKAAPKLAHTPKEIVDRFSGSEPLPSGYASDANNRKK